MMPRRFGVALAIALAATLSVTSAQSPKPAAKSSVRTASTTIQAADLKHWLGDIASDDMEGRGNGQEGLGLAASYIADELKALKVQPGGDNGTYFQSVKINGVNATSHSAVTVEANGQTRTFKDGEVLTFPKRAGGKQTLTFNEVEFVGYGLDAPDIKHNDYAGKNVKDKLVVYIGTTGPKALAQTGGAGQMRRSPLAGRARYATEQAGAAAVIGPGRAPLTPEQMQAMAAAGMTPPGQAARQPAAAAPPQAGAAGRGAQPAAAGRGNQPAGQPMVGAFGGGRGATLPTTDFTTTERLDKKI
ncbi:MAG: hypothetical protein ACM3NQ_14295, partial [Bacteroidales bacterium]